MKILKYSNEYDNLNFIVPSKECIPEWYKKSSKFSDKDIKIKDGNISNKTFKLCIPFLDSMLTGYTVVSWQDCYFKKEDNSLITTWPTKPDIVGIREVGMSKELPCPAGHLQNGFWWHMPFSIETPKGYSILITHPFNRFDLPFTTVSAIVDSDEIMTDGKIPFFLKSDFEGIIPKGTPLFQIIPIKRESWRKELNNSILIKSKKFVDNAKTVFYGYYKNNIWKKKRFE